jgi:hypothetical protein
MVIHPQRVFAENACILPMKTERIGLSRFDALADAESD